MSESHPSQGVTGVSTGDTELKFRYDAKAYDDEQWLRYFIEERGKSIQEMANHCDMDPNGILYHVRKHDIDTGFRCPECDKVQATEEGMKRHASMQHDINLRGEAAECEYCGSDFRAEEASGLRFCSADCSRRHESEKHAQNRIKKECVSCGDVFDVKPYRENVAKYCSNECKARHQIAGWNKKEHPELVCEYCGNTYTVAPHAEDHSRYCSKKCTFKAYETRYRGEKNPNYIDGFGDQYYGPNWEEQAKKCRERDGYECQICGKSQKEHYRALTAHHIKPRREFVDENGNYDWREGNRLDNLVLLCNSCHGRYGDWVVLPLS